MRDDVREALENACLELGDGLSVDRSRVRRQSVDTVRANLLRLIRDLPDDLTILELREELE